MFETYSQQMVIMTAVMFQRQRLFCGIYFSVLVTPQSISEKILV